MLEIGQLKLDSVNGNVGQLKMKKQIKIWIFVISILIILFLISLFIINGRFMTFGGVNYFFMPFPIKVTSCGSSMEASLNCTYPWVWLGISLSIIFWILVVFLSYKTASRIFKD